MGEGQHGVHQHTKYSQPDDQGTPEESHGDTLI
jgi:hypothetical protein